MAKVEVKLTEEQIQSIKDYSGQIKSLGSFVIAVRKRPGMYIGRIGMDGFVTMFREVFQNAFDELVRRKSPCNAITITYDERSLTVIVEDNGRGIPFGQVIRIFTKEHTSVNFDKELYDYTSGTHGVGAKVTNALSSKFIVESYILGQARRVEFTDGIPWDKGELGEVSIPNKNNRQGTMVCFIPSAEIMGNFNCSFDILLGLVRSIMPLTDIGSKVNFRAIDMSGKEVNVVVENEDGLLSYIIDITKSPIIKPIMFSMDTGVMRAKVALTYDADNINVPEQIISFANFCPTETIRSSHMKGFFTGYRKYFLKYMNNIYLANGNSKNKSKSKSNAKKLNITEADIRTGLRLAIDVAHLEPIFSGQAKEEFTNEDVKTFVEDLTYNSLEQWAKENPAALQKICKYFKEIAELRSKTDEGKVKLSNQFSSTHNGLPAKFSPPTLWNKRKVSDNEEFELYIVEGDSAGGSGKNNRNNKLQGIMPLRGKMINCFETADQKCRQNAEVAGLMTIFEMEPKDFDITKFRWMKIITAADADPDGGHINALVLRFMLRYYPQVIQAGRFYKAVPPLYSIGSGKNRQYFTNRIDYVRHVQKEFSRKYTITTLEGKNLSNLQVTEFLYDNIDYVYELRKIGDRYRLDYGLLELYLFNRNESVATIGKLIKKRFRFMEIKSINKIPTAEGIINDKYNTLFMNDKLIQDSEKVIKLIDKNLYKYYRVNDEVVSIYDIMKIYEKTEPSSLTRYKGLGEMKPEELAISTILPGDEGQRVLIRYTMEDATKEINQIRFLESNKSKLLEDLNVTRIDVLD